MDSSGRRDAALNAEVQRAWDANAHWWDDQVGPQGNLFHRALVAPSQMELLQLKPGERVLEIACGNGQFARQMVATGAHVLATDFSQPFLEQAQKHTAEARIAHVEYRLIDATSQEQLLSLGEKGFDAAVCTMALMDMAAIDPLMQSLAHLLRADGRFVFSVLHPCFNQPGTRLCAEQVDDDGKLVQEYSVRVFEYLRWQPRRGMGIIGQPLPHYYFSRPLHELLGACFDAGFVMDALREPALPPGSHDDRAFAWINYSQLPPVLVVRMRLVN